MSRKSRRKTLSHAEIENFLCDLNGDETDIVKKAPAVDVVANTRQTSNSSDAENQVAEKNVTSTLSNAADDERRHRATVIRSFHKDFAKMQPTDCNTANMHACAKTIHQETDYALLPMRQLYPEQFEHSMSSLEGKKALLMSMQPMLSAAEKQRKIDSERLERFTRCKVGKSRARSSAYEYLDFDTNMRVSAKEYSRRYLLFLSEKKAAESASASAPILLQSYSSYPSNSQHSTEASGTAPAVPATNTTRRTPQNSAVLQDISLSVSNSSTNTSASNLSNATPDIKPSGDDGLSKPAKRETTTATTTDLDFLLSFDDDDEANCRVLRPAKNRSRGRQELQSQGAGISEAGGGRTQRRRRDQLPESSSSRRRTLSPASTQAILLQEMESSETHSSSTENDHMVMASLEQQEGLVQEEVQDQRVGDLNSDRPECLGTSLNPRKRSSGGGGCCDSLSHSESPLKVQVLQNASSSVSPVMQDNAVGGGQVDPFASLLPLPPAPSPATLHSETGPDLVSGNGTESLSDISEHEGRKEMQQEEAASVTVAIMESAAMVLPGTGIHAEKDSDATELTGIFPQKKETIQPEQTIHIEQSVQQGEQNVHQEEQMGMSEEQEREEEEERARRRYEVRLEVARWKYHWEGASMDAALVARRRRPLLNPSP